MDIQPGRIMNNFLDVNRKQYVIPVYQRNYAWPEEQCRKLFEDILKAAKNQQPHFCGSVVYAKINEKNGIDYFILIDGQQRFTTMYLLLKALLDEADTELDKEKLTLIIYNNDKFQEYNYDEQTKLKLKPIKEDADQLLLLLSNKYDLMKKESGIWRNYQYFRTAIKNAKSNGFSVTDIYLGMTQLSCARIGLDKDDNPQEIFERINSTGLELSLEDKIRNFVLMTDCDQEQLFENYWFKIECMLDKKLLHNFFLDYMNMKSEGFVREKDAYESFKDLFKKGGYTNESMLIDLLKYATIYNVFYNESEKYGKKINVLLDGFRKIKQTTIHMFLFNIFEDFEQKVITETELENILQFFLSYTVRRIVCEVPSNSLRGLYKTLYSRLFSDPSHKEKYYDTIVSFFRQQTSKDKWVTDEEFLQALQKNNLYPKTAACKYILASVENMGKEKVDVSSMTIEHIMPQHDTPSNDWANMLGDDWEIAHTDYLHRLGNLTLTGYNTEIGNRPYQEKLDILYGIKSFGKNTISGSPKATYLYQDVRQEKWTIEVMEKRAERISKGILNVFSIIEPSFNISFKDPLSAEYNIDCLTNIKNVYIEYYVMQGERFYVDNGAISQMLFSVADELYSQNPDPIDDMISRKEFFKPTASRIAFSYDLEDVKGSPHKLKNTDIYITHQMNANETLDFIRTLLDKYEIPHEDFQCCLKQKK